MSVRYTCPNCNTTVPGRPLLAVRRPPAEITCEDCGKVMGVPFTYRLTWCYGLSIIALLLPMTIWMLWGDLGKLGSGETWLVDVGAGLLGSAIVALLAALPVALVLRPKPRAQT